MDVAPVSSSPPLGDLSPDAFLDTYWQQKPLLVRDALPNWTSPLEPEELAGLACEEGVESRLILEEGGAYPWELRQGPFEESDFLSLPQQQWTLLVQEVDRLIPEVGALLDRFRFLPDWRIDDVMVSYAPTGGTVGPHVDNYDVFLIQGLGHREWRIGQTPVEEESIVDDLDVRILADFEPDETFVCGPGDLLYLPPRVAHYGIATDDRCMTYSVGFRAPSHRDLVGDFLQFALETQVDGDARYADPDLTPVDHPGVLREEALARVRRVLRDLVSDDAVLDRWFGQFITRPRRDRYAVPPASPVDASTLVEAVRSGASLRRGPATQVALLPHDDGSSTLFVNGDAVAVPATGALADAALLLADRRTLPPNALAPLLDDADVRALLVDLVNDGFVELPSPLTD